MDCSISSLRLRPPMAVCSLQASLCQRPELKMQVGPVSSKTNRAFIHLADNVHLRFAGDYKRKWTSVFFPVEQV